MKPPGHNAAAYMYMAFNTYTCQCMHTISPMDLFIAVFVCTWFIYCQFQIYYCVVVISIISQILNANQSNKDTKRENSNTTEPIKQTCPTAAGEKCSKLRIKNVCAFIVQYRKLI